VTDQLRKFLWMTSAVAVVLVGYAGARYVQNATNAAMVKRQEIVCPSLLSIARSPRDTLIVMRSEPLCNSYVLETLR
jgi:hypothetical protein